MTTPLIRARRRAARQLMDAAGSWPRYGSMEYLKLPVGDPAQLASMACAAEGWAREGDDLEKNLRESIERIRAAHKAAEDAEYAERVETHRHQWQHLRPVPGALDLLDPDHPRPPDLYDVGREYMAARRNGGR